ncbi:transmembrane channel-like protein 6 isoform X1 [Equus quagga]|uniref:transmembrane channel-like protein 6 isoform X1 n=1 Tax=Equus quagga TaxID=89248 RepID=UPI001EE17084|nr:transmembrane channel-like protein 6 isoform X1 [Equus quagga]XP_046532612.1 transmembrane channel-like protein 6 isoform X1 [Equus quagga]XP_046532613.1 transmembrane channel-like protein 6 isoform X1 [Equus quagga]XP_046532614.1 transmembrane channel-like protein 6 isoform X1 [Equus quagga]XP_046532615.1 transmembrane channel-like protein 6 isoform X1 [Equus quagga]XP_046532616.1 transmembrane channel-like protein 6 isoform X1 [Equus quagga]XP_046532617.1 transmembrane channel-like prote
MAQPPAFVFNILETPEDQGSQDPSPYDESEVHDSFHQLIQEQSQRAAEEGLELRVLPQREPGPETLGASGSGHQALLGPEGVPDYSTATLRILASMPSRTIGRSRGAILSQYYNRTVRLRRRGSRPPLGGVGRSARPSLRLYDLELDPTAFQEEEKRTLLVKELQGLTVAQRDHMLRGMPLSLAEKRSLREESWTQSGKQRGPQGRRGLLPCCSRLRYACGLALHSLGLALLSALQALTPWRYALKQIGGQFGSSVLSYFLFLKTLLAFNALLLLPLLAFIVGVQAAFPPAPADSVPTFTGLELLTGGGRFSHSVMYYGYYSNTTLNQLCGPPLDGSQCTPEAGGLPYNMPLAYLFTMGMSFFITCITLVYSMSRSFGESYRVGSTSGVHAITVFCSWDYKVTQKWPSRLQQDNIRTQLKELLAEWQLQQGPRSVWGRLRQVAILGFVWLLCLGTTLGCTLAVYAFSELMIKNPVSAEREWELLALPLVVCLLNLGAPYLYRGLAALERHDSPILEVYVAICRNLILKMVILGILCYHWLGRRVGALKGQCWENFVGQELYRLMVMDFVFTLLDTLFGELVWRFISEKQRKKRGKPEFDIARNVLELIYGQTLTWLGVLFSPLLPAMQIVKLLVLFYVKKTSLMANCRAPRRPWLASHMSTVFVSLLCFPSFLGAAIFLCYAIWQVRPSSICGPFRTLDTMYEAGKVWVRHLEKAGPRVSWLPWIHRYLVENTFPIYLVSALLLAVIYLNIQVVKGQRKVICLLKEQISNEGEDKIFLINKLHSVYEGKERSRVGRAQEAEVPPTLPADERDAR